MQCSIQEYMVRFTYCTLPIDTKRVKQQKQNNLACCSKNIGGHCMHSLNSTVKTCSKIFGITLNRNPTSTSAYLISGGSLSTKACLMWASTSPRLHDFWNSKPLRMCPNWWRRCLALCLTTTAHLGPGNRITSLINVSWCCVFTLTKWHSYTITTTNKSY